MQNFKHIFAALFLGILGLLLPAPAAAMAADGHGEGEEQSTEKKEGVDAQGIIFEHLGDGYGWEVPFNHHKRIPLPVIVWDKQFGFHVFSSSRITHGEPYTDGDVTFKLAGKESKHKGKVVAIVDGKEIKPTIDISITKNVCGVFIAVLVCIWLIIDVARWHKAQMSAGTMMAPRRLTGAVEFVILFIYDGVIRPTLGKNANRFAPYLLTVFFFILVMNLLGLIVVFPGGANLTGNIAVTLVLALLTFFITNLCATKHYWKEIFNPDVPWWLKWPLPIMPLIEVFGIFTKPAALTVRLFANMMGGHMIVIVLTLLIFIFAFMGPAVTGATAVVSIIFSVFMLCIDVLVSFIQAYVFTMLSTLFIALGQEEGHEKHEDKEAHAETRAPATPATATPAPAK